jgi:hypothetical protein
VRALLDRYRLTPANLVAGAIGIALAVALFVAFLLYVSHYSS